MALNQNQFKIQPIRGERDMAFGGDVISGQIYISDTNTSIPGHPLLLQDTSSKLPEFTQATAANGMIWGFALYNIKDVSYVAGAKVEVGMSGTVMYMTANAAIAKGALLEIVPSTTDPRVITNAGTNTVVGKALDKAIVAGDLIRVYIVTPMAVKQTV